MKEIDVAKLEAVVGGAGAKVGADSPALPSGGSLGGEGASPMTQTGVGSLGTFNGLGGISQFGDVGGFNAPGIHMGTPGGGGGGGKLSPMDQLLGSDTNQILN